MKKISVVSGGSGGLGLAIAEQLAGKGKNVLLLGRNASKLEEAKRKVEKAARKKGEAGRKPTEAGKKPDPVPDNSIIRTLVCNVGNETDIRNTGQFLRDNNLITEYLFNNAGKGHFAPATEADSVIIDDILEANLKGLILLSSEILKITPEEEELTIINIMSTSALLGRDQETIYCAAKWGARGYTEALRAELKGSKRNIIAVYPGGMKTGFYEAAGVKRNLEGFMNPEEVAEKIVSAVLHSDRLTVSDITINRKK